LIEHFLVPMYAYDRPRMGQMDTSLYLLCRVIKQEATVALSGESADEVFGGYPWFHQPEVWQAQTFPWARMRRSYGAWLRAEWQQRLPGAEYEEQCYQQALAEVPRLPEEDQQTKRMREIFYFHLTRFLPMLLDRKDRMSMAVGLEVRVPFCDPRLVQYVWNIPWWMKTLDGREKGILRRALWDVLPEEVRNRKKSAYPSTFDPAYVQAVQQWVQRLLNETDAPIWNLFDRAQVRALTEQPAAAFQTEMGTPVLDFLIQTNSWLDTYQVTLP
jgi:asparagine synthase (glutamine-hydrolysing)